MKIYSFFILFFGITSFCIILSNDNNPIIERPTIEIPPLNYSNKHDLHWSQEEESSCPIDTAYQTQIMLFQEVLESAPLIIKNIVASLNRDGKFRNAMPQRLLLVGPPGVGKTTLAKAIAFASNRTVLSIDAPFVANEYKNSGAQNLMHIFQDVLSSGQPTVIIIDEFTCLTDRHKDPHNPEVNIAEALWLCLDACKNNPEILIIGTTNDATQMPEQLKSRFDGCVVEIPLGDTPATRKLIINHHLETWDHSLTSKDLDALRIKQLIFLHAT